MSLSIHFTLIYLEYTSKIRYICFPQTQNVCVDKALFLKFAVSIISSLINIQNVRKCIYQVWK